MNKYKIKIINSCQDFLDGLRKIIRIFIIKFATP